MNKRIITISRACGSGGRTIGRLLAEKLNISYYDKRILEIVAQKSGLAEEVIEEQGEYAAPSFLYSMATNFSYAYTVANKGSMILPDQINAFQTEVIQTLAENEPCVIVGRASDYILREREDCLHVFIHASPSAKKQRIIQEYGVPPDEAEAHIRAREKKRVSHYRHYTDREWGEATNYHLCLSSSELGIQRCVDLILLAIRSQTA